jgi:hypothetical protein
VLNLKGARDGLVHNSGGAQTSQQSYATGPASRAGGHNIALKKYNAQTFNDTVDQADLYDGVKVQVSFFKA